MSYRDHPVGDLASVLTEEAQFIDVRRPDEFGSGSIGAAVNIPLDQLAGRVGELEPGRRVVLLCRSGNRSGQAAQFLAAAGFADVINLAGGVLDYAKGESS